MKEYTQLQPKMRAAGYARVSTDEQKKHGYSVSDQVKLLKGFCEEHELHLVETYTDEGVSATLEIEKRHGLARMIEDAKQGRFDVVVFKCIDRFFRNVGEYYACLKMLQRAGVSWVSIEEPDLDPLNEDASFKINIYLSMAEYEAKKTSKRIKFNNQNRIANKDVVTGAFLFPWKVSVTPNGKKLIHSKEYEDITKEIINHYLMTHSIMQVVEYVRQKGYSFSYGTIDKVLHSPLLIGRYRHIEGYTEPYLSVDEYNKLQELLASNSKVRRNRWDFIFSGVLVCPVCGRKMVGLHTTGYNGKDYHTYRCIAYWKDRKCTFKKAVSELKIEERLLDALEGLLDRFTQEVSVTPIKEQKADIKPLQSELERLNNMYLKGRISESLYDENYARLQKEIDTIKEEKENEPNINLAKIKALAESDWYGMYQALDRKHKNMFWRNLIQPIIITERNGIRNLAFK